MGPNAMSSWVAAITKAGCTIGSGTGRRVRLRAATGARPNPAYVPSRGHRCSAEPGLRTWGGFRDAARRDRVADPPDPGSRPDAASIHREAVEEPVAAGRLDLILAAAGRVVRRVPRRVRGRVVAVAVEVPDPRLARHREVAHPVAARRVRRIGSGVRGPVRLRPGEDVVLVRRVAAPGDHLAPLGERRVLLDVVPVAVQLGDVVRDEHALRVVPGPVANPVLRVDRRVAGRPVLAQVGVPRLAAGAGGHGEHLAVAVRAEQPPEVPALAWTHAGDEEAHGRGS